MKSPTNVLLVTLIVLGCNSHDAPRFVDPVLVAGSTGGVEFRLELVDVRRLDSGEGVEAKARWTCDDRNATLRAVVYEDLDRDGQPSPGEWTQTITESGNPIVFVKNSSYRSATDIELSRGTRVRCERVLEFATFE